MNQFLTKNHNIIRRFDPDTDLIAIDAKDVQLYVVTNYLLRNWALPTMPRTY